MYKIGISRVRNESSIITKTLDHVSTLVDEVIVYDDCSEDDTPSLCESHPLVSKVIRGTSWDPTPRGRDKAEGTLRDIVYREAIGKSPDWVYYFDADEYADFSLVDWDDVSINHYALRLFDFYITAEDIDTPFYDRKWMGPEYRDIPMLFRTDPKLVFKQRIPTGLVGPRKIGGYVKHYGKAISVEEWEKTCKYYIENRGSSFIPMFTNKWKSRVGKAVHTVSDFGSPLITWEDRKTKGIPLKKVSPKG